MKNLCKKSRFYYLWWFHSIMADGNIEW